jgi:hypothetical protein
VRERFTSHGGAYPRGNAVTLHPARRRQSPTEGATDTGIPEEATGQRIGANLRYAVPIGEASAAASRRMASSDSEQTKGPPITTNSVVPVVA